MHSNDMRLGMPREPLRSGATRLNGMHWKTAAAGMIHRVAPASAIVSA